MLNNTKKYPSAGHVHTFALAVALLIGTGCSDALTSFDPDTPTDLTVVFERAQPVDLAANGVARSPEEPSVLRGRFWTEGAVEDVGEYDETMSGEARADERQTVFIERALTGRRGTLKVYCAGCVVEGTVLVRGRFEIRGATGRYADFENATAMIDPNAEIGEGSIRRVDFALR